MFCDQTADSELLTPGVCPVLSELGGRVPAQRSLTPTPDSRAASYPAVIAAKMECNVFIAQILQSRCRRGPGRPPGRPAPASRRRGARVAPGPSEPGVTGPGAGRPAAPPAGPAGGTPGCAAR